MLWRQVVQMPENGECSEGCTSVLKITVIERLQVYIEEHIKELKGETGPQG